MYGKRERTLSLTILIVLAGGCVPSPWSDGQMSLFLASSFWRDCKVLKTAYLSDGRHIFSCFSAFCCKFGHLEGIYFTSEFLDFLLDWVRERESEQGIEGGKDGEIGRESGRGGGGRGDCDNQRVYKTITRTHINVFVMKFRIFSLYILILVFQSVNCVPGQCTYQSTNSEQSFVRLLYNRSRLTLFLLVLDFRAEVLVLQTYSRQLLFDLPQLLLVSVLLQHGFLERRRRRRKNTAMTHI